jgi:glycosyltransferase involved in cell wall biosynthesis
MENPRASTPVTIGIPLYRSRRFVDTILRNVRAIDYPGVVEILISDRHQDDDALDVLAEALKDDVRVKVLRAKDRVGWVDHFNALLHAATGEYFMWMLHDDHYPAGFIGPLAACLDAQPDVVAACPRGIMVNAAGKVISQRSDLPDHGSPAQAALRMLTAGRVSAVHSLMRRKVIAGAGLSMRHTSGDVDADMYWNYGVRLCGRVVRVPEATFTKLMHPQSESAGWGTRKLAHVLDGFVIPWSYARDLAAGPREVAYSYAGISVWGACRGVGWFTRDWRWFPKTGAKRLVSRVLTGRG